MEKMTTEAVKDLTSYERIMAAAKGRLPDCVPVAPYMGNHGAKVGGAKISEYCKNGKVMAQAQLKAWEIYGQDMLVPQSDNYYIAEGFGVKTRFPLDSTPVVVASAVRNLDDIYRLKVPDPARDGRMPVYLEAIGRIKDQVGSEAAIRSPGTGPFSLAGHLMGTEEFLMCLAVASNDPDSEEAAAMKHLMELTSDALIAFLSAAVKAGADVVVNGDSLASNDMISPKMYREWAWPYERKVFHALRTLDAGKPFASLLHICGDMTHVLSDMADTGADLIEIDYKVSLKTAKALVGDRVCLIGNLDPSSVLLYGTPERVAKEAQQCIDAAGEGGRFILGSGCELALFTPQENVKAMIATARKNRY